MSSFRIRARLQVGTAALVVVSGALAVLPARTAHAIDYGNGSDFCSQDIYDVPAHVIAVDVVVIGESGANGGDDPSHGGGVGGHAGQVGARLPVAPGERLIVGTGCITGGGSTSGGNGGRGSGIFSTTAGDPADRSAWHPLVVAGGGGGGGGGGSSGPGGTGGNVQSKGNDGSDNESAAGAGGAGATATSGGAGGNGGCYSGPGFPGLSWASAGQSWPPNGDGGSCGNFGDGGGGGGGYYAGGGGGGGKDDGGGGGGGGSDYVDPSATNVVETLATGQEDTASINPVLYSSTSTLTAGTQKDGSYTWPSDQPDSYNVAIGAALNATGTVTYQARPASGGPTITMGSLPVSNDGTGLMYTLPGGVWSVGASYSGDAMDLPSAATPITMTIGSPPQLLADPTHADVDLGMTATFTAQTVGDPMPTADWQESLDSGATWLNDGPGTPTYGGAVSTLTVPTNNLIAQNGSLYRVTFSNPLGSVTSAIASLSVDGGAAVLTSPTTARAFDGNQVGLLSEAEGNPRPDATWQVSSDGGGTWTDISTSDPTFTPSSSVDTPLVERTTLLFQSASALNGREFRVRWTNTVPATSTHDTASFTVYSQSALFIWMPLPSCIVPNPTPANHANCHGVNFDGQFLLGLPGTYGDFSDATFTNATLIDATFGSANLSGADLTGADAGAAAFQGATLTGATLHSTRVMGANFQNADLTGADLSGADFTNTIVSGANFTHTQAMPADVTFYEAGPVLASPVWGAPAGVTGLTTACGYAVSEVFWNNGPNAVPCTAQATVDNGTGTIGTGTITVTLVPLAGPQVTTDPTDATTMFQPVAPYSATFSAAASGAPPPTVQWQVSTDHGVSFSDIANETNPTLTVNNPPVSANGTEYRAVFTNSSGTATSNPATLHVGPAPIVVSVQGQQTYGGSPTFTPSIVGLPPGVTVSGKLTCSALLTPDFSATMPISTLLKADSYNIDTRSCGGLTLSDTTDYAVDYAAPPCNVFPCGDFTVQPVTITVSVSGTKNIPGPVTFTEVDNAPAGILPAPFGFGCTTLSDGTPIASDIADGSYTVLGSSCSGAPPTDPVDYVIAYQGMVNGFTVHRATVQIDVAGYQTYGSTSPTFTETDNTGALGVPPLAGTLACTGVATPILAVGSYPLPGSDCGGLSSPVLPVQYQDGQFQVLPAPLDITADNQSMVYGGSLPTFTYQATGLMNGDKPAALGITCSAPTAGTAPAVGTYPIVCGGTSDANYQVVGFTHGTLTVTPANATVVADDQSMAYGGTMPTFTYHVTGLVNNDAQSVVSGVTCTSNAPASPVVGSYTITCSGGTATNYTLGYASGKLTVLAAALSVTANDKSMVYGGPVPTYDATVSGLVGSDTFASLGGSCSDASASATTVAGTHTDQITCSGVDPTNYTVTYHAGTLTVTQRGVTVIANDATMVYGKSLPTFTSYVTGLVNGDPQTAVTGATCGATTAGTKPAVGTYEIDCTGGTANNYTVTGYAPGTLTVTPATATVNADAKTMTYGGAVPSFTDTVTGLVNGDGQSAVSGVSCTSDAATPPVVGSFTITCSGGTAANYTLSYLPGTLEVDRASLTVTADDKSMSYGGTVPALTATITGFVNNDGSGVVSGTPACTTTATSTPAAGKYAITCGMGTLSASNYSFTFAPGTLTVGTTQLTVTADAKSMTYGGTVPALTATITGFVNNDGSGAINGAASCTSTGTSSSPVGGYPITCALGTLSASNYTFTFAPSTLTIGPAQLTVTADAKSMTYGATVPALTATITGFVNSDGSGAVSGTASCSSTGTSSSPATTYAITCALGTVSASNYTFTFAPGTLTIGPASLSVTAKDKSITYGGPAPAFDATVQGLIAPDTFASLGGACGDAGATTAAVGTHTGAITCSGITSTNYAVTYGAGTLTVTAAPVTVVADPQSMVYGGSLPTLTYSVGGLVNGDDPSVVTGVSCTATGVGATSPVGPYTIVCSSGSSSSANYTVTGHTTGTLQVTPATATVVADNKSIVFGTTVPPFTYHVDGMVNGDPATLITGVVCTSINVTRPIALSYGINCSGGSSSSANYTVAYASGTFTVTRAPLTVIANDKSMTYGGTVATFDATLIGLVPPDTFSGFGGTCFDNYYAGQFTTAGTYPGTIICQANRGLRFNYSVTFKTGTLTVNPAHLTVAADNKSMTYGDTVPPLTYSISGFVNYDPSSVVSGAPSCTTLATSSSPAGQYAIHCAKNTLWAYNYDFLSSDGTLTIGKHGATVGYTGGAFFSTPTASTNGASVTLQALVVPGSGGTVDLTKAQVTFDLYPSGALTMSAANATTCTATSVSAAGVALCTMPTLGVDNWTVVPVIPGGNGFFTAPAGDPVVVTVYQPTPGAVATGGGWVNDMSPTVSSSNHHGNFGFNLHNTSTGPKGQSVYSFRGANGYDYVVKSNSWQNGGDSIGTSTASFSGKCVVIAIDPTTGLQVTGIGGGNYSYRVDATAKGTNLPASYAISVYTPAGVLWHQAGTTKSQLALGGGNIVIHLS